MKFLLILCVIPFALKAELPEFKPQIPVQPPFEVDIEITRGKEHKFSYVGVGGYLSGDSPGIDCTCGLRERFGYLAYDVSAGANWVKNAEDDESRNRSPAAKSLGNGHIAPFIQGSILCYPLEEYGPYIGVGMNTSFLTMNIPLTLGYQQENHQFTQLQFCLLDQSGTLSYGVGF